MRKSFSNALQYVIYGGKSNIATLNFGGGVNGIVDEASPTEFVTSKKSVEYHEFLYSLQKNAMLCDYSGISDCLLRVRDSNYVSTELKEMIVQFISNARESPMFDFIIADHLATDVDKDRPSYKYGNSADVETPALKLYELHSSKEVVEQYSGKFAPLWFFDLMGIWFREASLESLRNIIEESPLVGVTSMMITEKLLSSVEHCDFVLAQEFHRGDNIDDLVRRLGWSIIRNVESTAFLYRTKSVYNRSHPLPHLAESLIGSKRVSSVMTPLEFYEDGHIQFDINNSDKKLAKKAKDEIKIINKANTRTMFVYVGYVRFAIIHWSQPKTDDGVELQQSYFEYLTDEGYIVGGDTNTSSKKIALLVERMGPRLLGNDPTLSTSDKMRTRLGTHGQYLREDKAGVVVSDPKSQIMVPYFLTNYHRETHIFSDGPVGTRKWPSDHKGKMSTFRGFKFF
jgi:hypothetical protein